MATIIKTSYSISGSECFNCKSKDVTKPAYTPESQMWQFSFSCNVCKANHLLTLGDKMGGGFDNIVVTT